MAVLLWTVSGPASATQNKNCPSKLTNTIFPALLYLGEKELPKLNSEEKRWHLGEAGELPANFYSGEAWTWCMGVRPEICREKQVACQTERLGTRVRNHWNNSAQQGGERNGSAGKGVRLKKKNNHPNTQRQHVLEERWKQEVGRSSERETAMGTTRQLKWLHK